MLSVSWPGTMPELSHTLAIKAEREDMSSALVAAASGSEAEGPLRDVWFW